MDDQSSLCIRCGKVRIKGTEKSIMVGTSKVKVTTFVCPDKECQKIVEKELAAKEALKLQFNGRRNYSGKKKTP
jgi:hypothetical protein